MNIAYAVILLGVLGALFGLILAIASKIFEVKKDPREEAILSHLAGANCGGCGYPGCGGCAAAILAGDAPVTACAPAGAENAAAIAEIMGMAAPTGEREVAFVRCTGGINAKKRYVSVIAQFCIDLRVYSYHFRIQLNTPHIIKCALYHCKSCRYYATDSKYQYKNRNKSNFKRPA